MLTGGYVRTGPGLPKRINEGLLDQRTASPPIYDGWMWHWLFGLFMFLGGAAAMLVSMTIVLMPYDEAFLNLSREELMAINPNIYYFMQHDRMTVAGTMVSGGILYMQLARYGVRHGLEWAKRAIHIAGVLGFLGILLFIGFGYFDWLHGILWLVLLPFFGKVFKCPKIIADIRLLATARITPLGNAVFGGNCRLLYLDSRSLQRGLSFRQSA